MKIEKLLMDIRNKEFKLERGLEIKKYLPMEVKKTIAKAIIYDCTSEDGGVIKVDSVERYMSYVRHMITAHTNLEYTDENYDVLCSTEYNETTLLNAIMKCFEVDATECSRILNLMTDDLVQAHSLENMVGQFLDRLGGTINGFANMASKKIGGIDLQKSLSKDLDLNKLSVFLEKYIK